MIINQCLTFQKTTLGEIFRFSKKCMYKINTFNFFDIFSIKRNIQGPHFLGTQINDPDAAPECLKRDIKTYTIWKAVVAQGLIIFWS